MMFDRNRDGALSADEIANVSTILKRMDRNRDGKLTSDELPGPRSGAGGPGRPGERRGPGRAGSPDNAGPERRGPGEGNRGGRGGQGGRGGDSGRPGAPGAAGRPGGEGQQRNRPTPDSFLQRFDRNKNGKVEGTELPEGLKALLERADANKDGALDLSEIKKLFERRAGGNRPEGRGPAEGRGDRPRRERPGQPPERPRRKSAEKPKKEV